MRRLEALSPTAFMLFEKDPKEFYMKYMSDTPPPKIPQTKAMSIGSAFDAHVKSFISKDFLGSNDARFQLATILENQVEKQNRDWATAEGAYAFECYKISGALSDLMLDLKLVQGTVRMEFRINGVVNNIPLRGNPDLFYVTGEGARVNLDWKVNGYCSTTPPSPAPGYISISDGWSDFKQSRTHRTMHKDCVLTKYRGVMINCARYMETVNKAWATQLAIYSWIMGEPIGSDFIVAVDQLVCQVVENRRPLIRVARHRTLITKDWQQDLIRRINDCWSIINSDHVFRAMSQKDSVAYCKMLDTIGNDYRERRDDSKDRWFNEMRGK